MLLTIEKLVYGGDGLAHLPADSRGPGKAVFVPFVLPGEKIEASLTEQKAGFARAQVDAILEPSAHRTLPQCPYFQRCGGCHFQHFGYERQIEIKKEILRETLRRTAKLELKIEIEVHPSPPWNYRNRSRLQLQTGPEFAAGYFKFASHQLLPVEECPISSRLINRGIAALWAAGRGGKVPGGMREVEFFGNADDTQLLMEVWCASEVRRSAVRACGEELLAALPEIAGLVAYREPGSHNQKDEKLVAIGSGHLAYRTERAAYRVSAGSFFQTNRHLIDELVRIVTARQSGELALDLYAGVGLFSTVLASDFRHVVSVESSQTSSADLAYNQPANGEIVRATTEQYLASAASPGRGRKGTTSSHLLERTDFVVVDPPRSGLGERVARTLATLRAPRLAYVSCDPATLARDLAILHSGGYRVESMHLVDLFPQTYHIESVVHLVL